MNHGYRSRREIFLLQEFLQTNAGKRIDRHRKKVGPDEESRPVSPSPCTNSCTDEQGNLACHRLEEKVKNI